MSRIDQYLDDNRDAVASWLSEGIDIKGATNRLKGMIQATFPDYDRPTTLADILVRQVAKAIERSDFKTAAPTINVTNNVTNNYYGTPPAPAAAPAEQPKPKKVSSLIFRMIRDDALTTADRVVYSYLRAFKFNNEKRTKDGKAVKPATETRLRRHTGYRPSTVKASVQTLIERSYVDSQLVPIDDKDARVLCYKRVQLTEEGNVERDVFRKLKAEYPAKKAGWWFRVMGISRRTYYRWSRVVTDGTAK